MNRIINRFRSFAERSLFFKIFIMYKRNEKFFNLYWDRFLLIYKSNKQKNVLKCKFDNYQLNI